MVTRRPAKNCCSDDCIDFEDFYNGSGSIDASDYTITGTINQVDGYAELYTDGDEAILTASTHTNQQLQLPVKFVGTHSWFAYLGYTDSNNFYKVTVTGQSVYAFRVQVVERLAGVDTTLLDSYQPRERTFNSATQEYDAEDFITLAAYTKSGEVFLRTTQNLQTWYRFAKSSIGNKAGFGKIGTTAAPVQVDAMLFGPQGDPSGQGCIGKSQGHYTFHTLFGDPAAQIGVGSLVTGWPTTGDATGWRWHWLGPAPGQTTGQLGVRGYWSLGSVGQLQLCTEPYENNYGIMQCDGRPAQGTIRYRFNEVNTTNYHCLEVEFINAALPRWNAMIRLIKVTGGLDTVIWASSDLWVNFGFVTGSDPYRVSISWQSDGSIDITYPFDQFRNERTTSLQTGSWHSSGYGMGFSSQAGSPIVTDVACSIHANDPQ